MRFPVTLCFALGLSLSSIFLSSCATSISDPGAPFNPRMTSDGGSNMPQPPAFDLGSIDLMGTTPCSTAPQGGCAAGQKCTTYDYSTTLCAIDGTVTRGAHCVQGGPDNCRAGMLCTDEDTGGTKTQCRPFCMNDNHCAPGGYCEIALNGGLRLCTNPCDPMQTGSCAAGLGCYLYGSERSDCVKPGSSPPNGPCNGYADCQAGLICIPKGASGVCHSPCKLGGTGCAGFEICTTISDGSYTWKTYGVCCPSGGC